MAYVIFIGRINISLVSDGLIRLKGGFDVFHRIARPRSLLAILQPPSGSNSDSGVMLDGQGRDLTTATPWQGFLLGYVSGFVWYAGCCFWIYNVMHNFGGLDGPVAVGVLILFCLFYGFYHALFRWLLARVARPDVRGHGRRKSLFLTPL